MTEPMGARWSDGTELPPEPEGTTPETADAAQYPPGHPERVKALRAELLTSAELDSIPAPRFVVKGLLQLDSLAEMYGASGTYKSFVALDMAGCVGSGDDWHGHRVLHGTVLYIVAEGKSGIRPRVRVWEQGYRHRMHNVYFLPRPVQAADSEWADLVELAREDKPVLVILDTRARVTFGMNENDTEDMGEFVVRAEQLRTASGGCVLTVHHTGKDNNGARGNTAVRGALHTELKITRVGKDGPRAIGSHPDAILSLATTKQKDVEEAGEIHFSREVVTVMGEDGLPERNEDGDVVTSVVLHREETEEESDPAAAESRRQEEESERKARQHEISEADNRRLMEDVSMWLEDREREDQKAGRPVKGWSGNAVIKAVTGRPTSIRVALEHLVHDGYVTTTPGRGRTVDHRSATPYRADMAPVVPGGSRVVPDQFPEPLGSVVPGGSPDPLRRRVREPSTGNHPTAPDVIGTDDDPGTAHGDHPRMVGLFVDGGTDVDRESQPRSSGLPAGYHDFRTQTTCRKCKATGVMYYDPEGDGWCDSCLGVKPQTIVDWTSRDHVLAVPQPCRACNQETRLQDGNGVPWHKACYENAPGNEVS